MGKPGQTALPARQDAHDHRRLRRLELQPHELWKVELQRLADLTGLEIIVCHFPPGTSKWNKIEHRLFSFISTNWRGKPLISHEVIINLINATTTTTGLKVYAQLDDRDYPKSTEVTRPAARGSEPHTQPIPRRMELPRDTVKNQVVNP